jgi:flavorubredoxin
MPWGNARHQLPLDFFAMGRVHLDGGKITCMSLVTEIAPDVYRLSIFVPELNIEFSHFLVKDDEPLLYHTGYNSMFPPLREAMAQVMDPAKLRWISFSHFESDECGSLNKWLEIAPHAQVACTFLGAALNLNDFAIRAPKAMNDGEVLSTGKYRLRMCSTAHIPHGWDAGVLFEETQRTLFCSDICFHTGECKPLTESEIISASRAALLQLQASPFAYSVPYTPQTDGIFERLAALQPKTLATMHGSSFTGNGEQAILDFAAMIKETLGGNR